MMRATRLSLATALGAVLVLAGCGQPSAPDSTASSTAAPAASAPAKPASAASTASLPGDHAQTKRYRIDISYPQLPASEQTLTKALHQAGDKAKRVFMRVLPDPKEFPEWADRQLQLILKFSVAARMPAFVSIREQGMVNTG